MAEQTAKFEGWAVIELFGHQRETGYITTEYFGGTALFRVEVPLTRMPSVPFARAGLQLKSTMPSWGRRVDD